MREVINTQMPRTAMQLVQQLVKIARLAQGNLANKHVVMNKLEELDGKLLKQLNDEIDNLLT